MLIENLLMHAEDAELQFPKACQSARDLAEQIKEARLTSLAEKAVNSMLIPDGQESYQLAERLRTEMRKMFNDMQQGINEPNPYMQNEFDNYLRLMLGMEPGSTFQQMCQSRRFGLGRGKGRGMGSGMAGSGGNGGPQSGYNMGPQIGLLGNENLGNPGDKEGNGDGKHSKGRSDGDANEVVAITQDKNSKALNSRKMTGEAVSSDNLINEYESLIDAYFEKITEEE